MLKFFNFRKLIEDSPNKKKKIIKSYVPLSQDQDETNPQSDVEHIFCLYYGIGIKKNEEYAKQLCLNDSLKDNLIVKGIKYYNGWDVDRDFKKSFECFKKFYDDNQFVQGKAKEKGYCLNMIAYFYKEGKGVPKNTELAISLYKKAIEMGNSMAMNNLAYLYKSGKGMKKDVNRAIQLYEEAIQQGNISSMYNLAYLYEQGDGIEKDLKKSIHLYEKAIKMRNTMAMNNLAMIYKNGKGIKKDINKAIELYGNAIDLKNKNAMYNLAYLYEEGKEVPKDINRAIHLYKLSCDQGNSSAYNNLGMIYKKGCDGIERNINEAVSHFEKAIELGNKNSMINLAILYEEGNPGFQIDLEKSAFYFHKLILCFDENEYGFKRKLSEILSSRSVEWQTDYHQFWRSSYFLDSQLMTLLLISKSRRDSKDDRCSFLVKGITMMVIKHLCHYSQI